MTQEAFADECGFDRTYISGIERGVRNPSLDAIEILAKALSVRVPDLFK
jgi:transcriptional regulator with XRE-family HTH domain